ncbi:MAG: NADPH:quinone reductase, partial [Acidimicrobiaceae bacterium]|nr:NADPH:quinone reductase [Acidimicrobiaceae bacterium]
MTTRMVIIGGGPAGHSCASTAARLGADVVVIERDTIGGAAHLWDCIPSKAMIATGNARQFLRRSARMGLAEVGSDVDLDQLRDRLKHIESRLETTVRGLLDSQRVELVDGFGQMVDAHTVVATLPDGTERTFHADVVVLSTGSRPRIPEWAPVDGERVLSTRDAYPPSVMPEHVIVIGSGVTGVEFVHMF